MYDWLLFLHLMGAVLAFAAIAVLGAGLIAATRSERPAETRAFLGLARPGGLMFDVGGLLLLVFGIWLAFEADYGITDEWIVASIALWIVAAFAGTRARMRLLGARDRVDATAPSTESDALVAQSGAVPLYGIAVAAVLAMLLLMIFKPGAN